MHVFRRSGRVRVNFDPKILTRLASTTAPVARKLILYEGTFLVTRSRIRSPACNMAQVVYTAVNDQSELKGSLFQGQRIWFSQKVPQRTWFIKQVEVRVSIIDRHV